MCSSDLALYEALRLERTRIRLVGVRCENLTDSAQIQGVLGDRESGWRETEQVMDEVARKFPAGKVRPARLVRPDNGRLS